MMTITGCRARDIRFPTSRQADGSDAMNPDPDYSAAYVVLTTDRGGLEGHGLTFTLGRGNELCVAAIDALAPLVVGRTLADITGDMGGFWRELDRRAASCAGSGRRRASIHLATAAIVNASGISGPSIEGKPVWRLVADMTPEQFVGLHRFPLPDRCADAGRGAGDPATPTSRARRSAIAELERRAFPPTPPRPAGSATPTTSSAGSAARRSPMAGPSSRSRSAAISRTTCAAAPSCARRSAPTAS